MTSTAQCNLMNAIYDLLKPLTIAQVIEARARYEQEGLHLATYCAKETLRRKRKGIW